MCLSLQLRFKKSKRPSINPNPPVQFHKDFVNCGGGGKIASVNVGKSCCTKVTFSALDLWMKFFTVILFLSCFLNCSRICSLRCYRKRFGRWLGRWFFRCHCTWRCRFPFCDSYQRRRRISKDLMGILVCFINRMLMAMFYLGILALCRDNPNVGLCSSIRDIMPRIPNVRPLEVTNASANWNIK